MVALQLQSEGALHVRCRDAWVIAVMDYPPPSQCHNGDLAVSIELRHAIFDVDPGLHP